MEVLFFLVTTAAAFKVGSWWSRRKESRAADAEGYRRGYSAGYEGAGYDLQRTLGEERFNELVKELHYESQRPAGWQFTVKVDNPRADGIM